MNKTTIVDLNTNKEYDITELKEFFNDNFKNNLLYATDMEYKIITTDE